MMLLDPGGSAGAARRRRPRTCHQGWDRGRIAEVVVEVHVGEGAPAETGLSDHLEATKREVQASLTLHI